MHSEILHKGVDNHSPFAYEYLLEWDWPEHIEMLLRRLIWARLTELANQPPQDSGESESSDYLATKLCWLIAICPESPPAVLEVLSQMDSSAFAERVAENPHTAVETLARLSEHSSHQVRCAVGENPNTSADVLSRLAVDQHLDVRHSLAENHTLSREVLEILANDDNCFVATRAMRTLNRLSPPELARMTFRKTEAPRELQRKRAH